MFYAIRYEFFMKKHIFRLLSLVLSLILTLPGFQIHAENADVDNSSDNNVILFASDSFVTYYDPETKVMYDSLPEVSTFSGRKLFPIYHKVDWYQRYSCIALDITLYSPDTSARIKCVYGGLNMTDRNSGVSGFQEIRTLANAPIVNHLYSVMYSNLVFPAGHTIHCTAQYQTDLVDGEVLSGRYTNISKDYTMK